MLDERFELCGARLREGFEEAHLQRCGPVSEGCGVAIQPCGFTSHRDAVEQDLAQLVGPGQGWLSTMGYLEKVDEYLNRALRG